MKISPRKVTDMAKLLEMIKNIWGKVCSFVKNTYTKCKNAIVEWATKVNWKIVWDKTTTGILIFLIISPLLILAYIFLWFYMRQMA